MAAVVGMVDRAVRPDCLVYARGYKYQTRRPFVIALPELRGAVAEPVSTDWITLDPDGTLTIRSGYAWDGASGPTYDTKSSMRGSCSHDALYQLIRLGLLSIEWREAADRLFERLCLTDKMLPPRAWLWYHAVRIFASPAADPASESPDETAGCGCP
jgi:hypothetical protein